MSFKFSISPAEMAEREQFMVNEDLPDFGKYREGKRQASARESELHELFFLLSLHHFGVEPSISKGEILTMACSLATDFFAGDWWKEHARDIERLSREKGNEDLQWFDPFRLSLLFAALQGDESLVRLLAAWPEDWMTAEWRAVPFPEGIEQFYFAMNKRLGLSDTPAHTEKIQDSRIRLLGETLVEETDEKLAETLTKTLKTFSSRLKPGKILPYEAIAIEESIIVNLWNEMGNADLLQQIESEHQTHLLV